MLRWSDRVGRRLFGRPVPHVLLLHASAFDAATLDALLSAYERAGVRFVPLDDALRDPAYAIDPSVTGTQNETLLTQLVRARAVGDLPAPPGPPDGVAALCR